MKARIIILGLFLLLGVSSTLFAQPFEKPSNYEIPKQSIYLELGGNGIFYSLNYDVLFKNGYGIRLGGSYLYSSFGRTIGGERGPYSRIGESNALIGLVMGQKLIGEKASKFELGAGFMFGTIYDAENWDYVKPPSLTFSAGYRFFPDDPGKFTFKAAFTPIIDRNGFHPRFGLSLGVTLTPEGNTR
ncbi:hypothetical protein G3570_07095 [Balneolaceae bacterium YR4-1]|uniref:Outer membrane protein beta-barrel domain-containing protein n=1 Tax=Halalkalibaculum roseum TaxID=2709311 RepID=A0A6M1SM33_9BACT|nr:hypothetical protein [Halalkalibaculum roseum]NGP76391.1 hypothetical protein [Halalkalibaculum roseum]